MAITAIVAALALLFSVVLSIKLKQLLIIVASLSKARAEMPTFSLNWFTVKPETNQTVNYFFDFKTE
jgi:hypothetical protein